jgi:hypothetical protein
MPGGIGYHACEPIARVVIFMSSFSTIVLLPFILAFLIAVVRFYGRERASSMGNFSFVLASFTVLSAVGYLLLRIGDMMSVFGTIAFGVLGLMLLGTAVARMFMI